MIRQFLATTVENLRSFFSSLAGSDREPTSRTPRAAELKRAPQITRRPPPALNPPASADEPASPRVPGNRRLPSSSALPPSALPQTMPVSPQVETQRRRLRQAGILPPVAAEEPSLPPISGPPPEESGARISASPTPQTGAPAAGQERGAELASAAASASPEAAASSARVSTSRRATRVPHLFPTQSVPAQPTPPVPSVPSQPQEEEGPMRAPVHAPPPDAAPDSGPDSGPVEAELPLILPAERTPAEDAPDNYVPDESLPDEDMPDENGGGRSDFARPAQDAHTACNELHTLLEGLLFVAGEPVAPAQLARALGTEEKTVVEGLRSLAAVYAQQNRGLRIQAHREKYQLVTAPVVASHVERFLNLDTSSKLSGPALETLAVVAYRQPVTRSQVEAVRGVDCAAVLRSLTQRGLIEEVGRLDVAGRPFLYGVTELFMQHFGLTDLDELPPLEQTEADTLWAATALAELEGQDAPPESADDSAAPVAPVAAADSPARNAR